MTIRKSGEVSSDFVALGKSREKYSNALTLHIACTVRPKWRPWPINGSE